jgi:hypothetical protein
MKCRDCKFLSEPKVFGDPSNYPSVRCTLGLWDRNSPGGDIERWFSYGETILNRGPARRLGEACTRGESK